MIRFARLFDEIDRTTSTNAKVSAMAHYFADAPPADAAWAVFFLTGRRLKRLVPYVAIHDWTLAATGLPSWIIQECYSIVGDGAETAALVLDQLPPTEPTEEAAAEGDNSAPARTDDEPAAARMPPGDNRPPARTDDEPAAARLPPGDNRPPARTDDEPAAARMPPGDNRPPARTEMSLARWVEERIVPLRRMDPETQRGRVMEWWAPLDRLQRFVLLKMVTGELRVGVSQTLVVRALAQAAGLPISTVAARLMGDWTPSPDWFTSIMTQESTDVDQSRPYPFFLASPLEEDPTILGEPSEWVLEWKWDGIRAQLVRRGGAVHLWSRGEELITHRFPEIAAAATHLPDGTVLDGEVVAFRDDRPLPFSALQQRIGRQKLVAQMARAVPVVLMAYDILEEKGRDIRDLPLVERRGRLIRALSLGSGPETHQSSGVLRVSPIVATTSWDDLAAQRHESRARGVEGLMLKRCISTYGVGRRRGEWWKWKIDPYTIDAVLIYAQPGSGKRASLLTDYTFGVWHEGALVPVAKAYSGLSNEEIGEMDRWIRHHTVERFGPVRHVEPIHVFELGFEGIARSPRHKSGIAVRFPRMLRWRKDKRPEDADTLENVHRLLDAAERLVE